MNLALSRRRVEVLTLAAAGLTDKEIAERLQIRVRTVRFHFAACCQVLQARTRVQAAVFAASRGLIEAPAPTSVRGA